MALYYVHRYTRRSSIAFMAQLVYSSTRLVTKYIKSVAEIRYEFLSVHTANMFFLEISVSI